MMDSVLLIGRRLALGAVVTCALSATSLAQATMAPTNGAPKPYKTLTGLA